MAADAGRMLSPRTMLLLGAKIALSAALIAYLFHTRLDWADVRRILSQARVEGLVLAAVVMLASNILGAVQWNRLLRGVGIRIPFWKVVSYYHVGLFFNNFLPANVAGDLARVFDASRSGRASRTVAFSTVLMDRMVGTVALGGLAVLTTLPAILELKLSLAWVLLLYGGVLGFFGVAVFMFWAVLHPRALASLEGLLTRVGLGRIKPTLDELSGQLASFRGQPRLFMELFAVATGVQVMRIGVHVFVARALGLHVALSYFFLFVPLLAVIVSLPISFNGIGVREFVGGPLFGLVGVEHTMAVTLQSTTFLVAQAVSLIGLVVFLARIPHRRAESRVVRRPGE